MNSITDALAELVRQYPAWTDGLIGLGIIVQGEITLFLAMFLVVSGALPWREFFIATLGTLMVGELVVFFVGRLTRHTRFGWRWYRKMKPNRRIQYYSHYLRENLVKLFIISHFLVGVNFIVLVLAGWSKTSFGKFLKSYLVGLLTWFGTMALLAYGLMSGLSYLRSTKVFRQIEIGVVVVIVLIFGGEALFRKFLKGKFAIEENAKAAGKTLEKKMEHAPEAGENGKLPPDKKPFS